MNPRILLVNPPIYDFSAYDFWLKPYGLLRVAGWLRGQAELQLFDFLDRLHPWLASSTGLQKDEWGRGKFFSERIPKPTALRSIRRHYQRFGLPRPLFRQYLEQAGPFDFALIQTGMTYWYLGVEEVIQDLREASSSIKIILGGVYASLCSAHARQLKADLIIKGSDFSSLWDLLDLTPDCQQPPLWEAYPHLQVGVLKLTEGCPFHCTYCSASRIYPHFFHRPLEGVWSELAFLIHQGARNIAFYDDALLYQPTKVLLPFLQRVAEADVPIFFHTPNGLNARFVTPEIARALVQGKFKTFFLGFESGAANWQQETGGKVTNDDLARAVHCLSNAGATLDSMTAYVILGHPQINNQRVEATMRYIHDLGIRLSLADFSPIPQTPDGESCRQWVNLDEPLWHNKTAFTIKLLGEDKVNEIKRLCRNLNKHERDCSSEVGESALFCRSTFQTCPNGK
jgi:hypothetical protein